VFSTDEARAKRVASGLEVGMDEFVNKRLYYVEG